MVEHVIRHVDEDGIIRMVEVTQLSQRVRDVTRILAALQSPLPRRDTRVPLQNSKLDGYQFGKPATVGGKPPADLSHIAPAKCQRFLPGLGPVCWLPKGHAGTCDPKTEPEG